MKRMLCSFVFAIAFYAGSGQPKMQATIRQGSAPLSVDVYIRSSQTFSNRDENIIIVLALPINIKPTPSLGVSGTTANSLGLVTGIEGLQPAFLHNNLGTTMREVAVSKQAVNGNSYYLYTFVFGGTALTNHTWQQGVEQKACSIQFQGCTSGCNPGSVLLVNLPNGGAERNSYWYFQSNTISDITNYKEPFYANDQTGSAVNGGSSNGSALSYLSLKLAPAPAQLPAFKANAEGCDVKINWEASAGNNAAYYAIERSDDNINYKQIYKSDVTTTNLPGSYNTTDKTVLSGKSFYRLCMLDVNGKLTCSAVSEVEVNCPDRTTAVVTPTLGTGVINVQLASGLENAQVRAVNSFGVVILTDRSHERSRRLNLTNAGKGAYIIQVLKDGRIFKNVKVVVL